MSLITRMWCDNLKFIRSMYRFLKNTCLLLCTSSILLATPLDLSVKAITEVSDGMEVSYLKVTGNGFEGQRISGGYWVLSDTPDASASLSFYHRLGPDVLMHFGVFPDGELLSSYEEKDLRRYLASLIGKYARGNSRIIEPTAFKAPDGAIPFMGGRYWRIRYKLVDRDSDSVIMHVVEYLSMGDQGENYRLRFVGPPQQFLRMEGGFERELERFM